MHRSENRHYKASWCAPGHTKRPRIWQSADYGGRSSFL